MPPPNPDTAFLCRCGHECRGIQNFRLHRASCRHPQNRSPSLDLIYARTQAWELAQARARQAARGGQTYVRKERMPR